MERWSNTGSKNQVTGNKTKAVFISTFISAVTTSRKQAFLSTAKFCCGVFLLFRDYLCSQNETTFPQFLKKCNKVVILCWGKCVFYRHSFAHSYGFWWHLLSMGTLFHAPSLQIYHLNPPQNHFLKKAQVEGELWRAWVCCCL